MKYFKDSVVTLQYRPKICKLDQWSRRQKLETAHICIDNWFATKVQEVQDERMSFQQMMVHQLDKCWKKKKKTLNPHLIPHIAIFDIDGKPQGIH